MAKYNTRNKRSSTKPHDEQRIWIIKNVRGGYIKTSKDSRWTITMNIGDATRFHKDSARNMILNCLPKGQEENWIIVSAKEARNLTMDDVSAQQREIRQDRIINSAETTHNVDVYSIIPERFRDGSFDWVGHESEVSAIRKDLLEYRQILLKLEMQNHREEIDLRHMIELGKKPNVVEGYRLLMRYRDNLILRRKIKNDIMRCDAMLSDESCHQSGEVLEKLRSIDNQKYNPRALPDLFKDEDFINRKGEDQND